MPFQTYICIRVNKAVVLEVDGEELYQVETYVLAPKGGRKIGNTFMSESAIAALHSGMRVEVETT